MELSFSDWQENATALQFRTQAFIDGHFVDALSGKTFATIDPATGAEIAQIAECYAADIDRAVKAARATFEDGR